MTKPADQENDDALQILLVADNTSFLHIVSKVLNRHVETVVVGIVRDCEQAVEQAKTLALRIILIDLDMSGDNGIEVLSCIHKALPAIPIIALSLLDTSVILNAAVDAGANEFVHKLAINSELMPACWRATHPPAP